MHVDNLDLCLRRGGMYSTNHTPGDGGVYKTIHDTGVQANRHNKPVPCGPGGTLHDYVPFYFGPLSVMLLQLKTGRVSGYNDGQEPLVYVVAYAQDIVASGCGYVFTDGHSLARITEFFSDLCHLDRVDWSMVNQRYWKDTVDDSDRQRRKQAEFLVHRCCDWSLVREVAVATEAMKVRVGGVFASCRRASAERLLSDPSGTSDAVPRRPMIELTTGNLLLADADALVNTVNCVGFMGKGIALQFKQAFPDNFKVYERACRANEVQPGRMLVVPTNQLVGPKYIINFPTKRHWRGKSLMDDIEVGLRALVDETRRLGLRSIAVPPLGCGNGGLDWRVVKPKIEQAFSVLPDLRVLLFEPGGTPLPETMPVRTERPSMTPGRALLIGLLESYATLNYRRTLLEVQKLAYFLQEAGEPLRLNYVGHIYGPYAHALNKVLERMEGHFTRGYGDSLSPDVEIELLPGAADEAQAFLSDKLESKLRLARVAELIEGFETPHGMELLASVHWLARHGSPTATTPEQATELLQAWTPRKRALFKPAHVRLAWERLASTGWFD